MTALSKLFWNQVAISFALGALISSCDTASIDDDLRFVVRHQEIERQPWDDIEIDTGEAEFCGRIMDQLRRNVWEQRQAQSLEKQDPTATAGPAPRTYIVEEQVEVCGYPDERAFSGLAYHERE